MTQAGCIAAMLSLVALVGCGRIGFEPSDQGVQAGPAADAQIGSDAQPGERAGDAGADAGDDAGSADAGFYDCRPACGDGYICCGRECYPTSEPVPC